MSAEDEIAEAEEGEKKKYSLAGRLILFLVIAGPGTLIALGTWVRIGSGKNDFSMKMIFWLWLIGIIAGAIGIFKK